MTPALRFGCGLLLVAAASGCASAGAPDGLWPGRERWTAAFREAVRSPGTWAPAAGAAAVAAGGWDRDVSEWAVRETPVFGSPASARSASGDLRGAANVAMLASAFAGRGEEERWRAVLERVILGEAAAVATSSLTTGVKKATGRERPDGADDLSFPSGHASRAFSYAATASRNLGASRLPKPLARGLSWGVAGLAAGTAWARVEGGVHYPSDVLAGAALGNFVGVLVHEAFLGGEPDVLVLLQLDAERPAVTLRVRF